MITPQVALAGILEPAYGVAGDSFDYAINDNIVHLAVIDAMGHGLNAALLATLAISAYRHARRANVGLADLYGLMDAAIDGQFGPDQFVTAQMMRLDIATGHLQWVNAGHPPLLLIRDHRVVQALESPTTLPVGFGGAAPQISEQVLRRGDRVLFFTDGAIEEHKPGGEQFGKQRLIEFVEHAGRVGEGVQEMVRSLSHSLVQARGGATTDDATLFLVEWRGGSADHLATMEVLPHRQAPAAARDLAPRRCQTVPGAAGLTSRARWTPDDLAVAGHMTSSLSIGSGAGAEREFHHPRPVVHAGFEVPGRGGHAERGQPVVQAGDGVQADGRRAVLPWFTGQLGRGGAGGGDLGGEDDHGVEDVGVDGPAGRQAGAAAGGDAVAGQRRDERREEGRELGARRPEAVTHGLVLAGEAGGSGTGERLGAGVGDVLGGERDLRWQIGAQCRGVRGGAHGRLLRRHPVN